MGVRIVPKAELHPRHLDDARMRRERRSIAARYRASARDLFADLRIRLLASRPLIGLVDEGKPTEREILGPPTFRNVIDENGRHI